MLNTPAPSVATASLPAPPVFRRRRGSQPFNRNALKHGLYAVVNPTSLTSFSYSITNIQSRLCNSSASFWDALQELQALIVLAIRLSSQAETTSMQLSWDKLILRAIKISVRFKTAWLWHPQPICDLQFVARLAHPIIRLTFHDCGITRDADLFRLESEKSDFNSPLFHRLICSNFSDPQYPFIAAHQWALIEPLLPPPGHVASRGRPPVDPRELLDAVFWKFAHHARWQDLPDFYPPMLSCRRYYRRLFRSGRLATIYSALYKHLLARGRVDLVACVKKDCFSITKNKLILKW